MGKVRNCNMKTPFPMFVCFPFIQVLSTMYSVLLRNDLAFSMSLVGKFTFTERGESGESKVRIGVTGRMKE